MITASSTLIAYLAPMLWTVVMDKLGSVPLFRFVVQQEGVKEERSYRHGNPCWVKSKGV